MYYRGKMFGFVHLYSGQEAVSISLAPRRPVAFAIPPLHACMLPRAKKIRVDSSDGSLLNGDPTLPPCLAPSFCALSPSPRPSLPSLAPLLFFTAVTQVSTGVIKGAMEERDYVCSTYRDHVHALSKGVSSREVMAELFGKKTGCCRGQGGSMHMFRCAWVAINASGAGAGPRWRWRCWHCWRWRWRFCCCCGCWRQTRPWRCYCFWR